jgi:glycosyltransferase involved in cell wall biosynthesis
MKVLLVHEHGNDHGSGAVIAMYRLHLALQAAGVDSTIACRKRALTGDDVVELPAAPRTERLIQKFTWRLGLNDIHCVSSFKIPSFEPFADADVVNIHGWHTNFLNYLALPRLSRRKPIVATLHDMWHMTGHCAQGFGCDRWRTGCGRCPHLEAFPPVARDATAIEWRLKRWTYRRSRMHVAAPSESLVTDARSSILGVFPVEQIPNPVDVETYAPRDQAACRRALGLPLDRRVILFVSMGLTNHVKGGDLLVDALGRVPDGLRAETTLLALGTQGEAFATACDLPVRALGYVRDDEEKVTAYNAADVLVLPSRWENQSLVMLESMACGLAPVVYDVGGLAETVEHERNGYVAEPESVEDFARGITALLAEPSLRERWGRAAREHIVREHAMDVHARRYIALYERAMEASKA